MTPVKIKKTCEFTIQTPNRSTNKKICFYNNLWFDDYFRQLHKNYYTVFEEGKPTYQKEIAIYQSVYNGNTYAVVPKPVIETMWKDLYILKGRSLLFSALFYPDQEDEIQETYEAISTVKFSCLELEENGIDDFFVTYRKTK